jgi:Flp pilus assembly protein TadD
MTGGIEHPDLDDGNAARGLSLAQHWLEVNRPDRALEELGRLPRDEAMSLPACLLRVGALLRAERPAAAKLAATRALDLHGTEPRLLALLALACRVRGELEESERALLQALSHDPEDVGLLCEYAELCVSVGQLDKAEALLERAAAVEPDAEAVTTGRVLVAAARGRSAEAYRRAREALGRHPDSTVAHVYHSVVATEHGKFREAGRSSSRVAAETGDPDALAMARDDRVIAHPLLVPLRPLFRFGPLRTWVAVVVVLMILRFVSPPLAAAVGLFWIVYCVYSWVVPPLVRWYVSRRLGV